MRDTYRVVLVDEAQDVSPKQYRLIKAIGFERVVWIGDPQQSIYGFRDADVKHFVRTSEESTRRELGENHRATKPIQQFVDLACGGWWSAETDYRPLLTEPLDLEVTAPPRLSGVEVWDFERDDVRELASMVSRLKERLGDKFRWSDITVLVHRNAYASKLEEHLQELGVPSRTVGGSTKLYTRLEVRDVANALRAVADPTDSYALLCTLRSPLVGLSLDAVAMLGRLEPVAESVLEFQAATSQDQAKLDGFRSWYVPLLKVGDRLPAVEVLEQLFAVTPLLERLASQPNGTQALANVRKLLQRAAGEPEVGPLEFAEQIREIQEFRDAGIEAETSDLGRDELTIMTIHKAKGLESEVVVVAESFTKIAKKTNDVAFHRDSGLAAPKLGPVAPLLWRWAGDHHQVRETAEKQRLLYVALTRARQRLVVMASSRPGNGMEVAHAICRGLGKPAKWAELVEVRRAGETASEPEE
jgi:ATP-dependent exoDNAse (exonuclease V) beta subunit